MNTLIKNLLKEHIIRPGLRAVMQSDLVKDAVSETLAEEEFAGLPAHLQQQVVDGVSGVFGG